MINMRTFYGWASLLMGISLFGNLWNTVLVWEGLTIGGKVANIAGSVLFNGLIFILFFSLWRFTPSSTGSQASVLDSPELNKLIKKYQNV